MDDSIRPHVLLCARDPAVIESVEVSAAALDVDLRVVRDAGEVRAAWGSAVLRLVSTEVAARWSAVAPGKAFLVGSSASELARCSAELAFARPAAPGRGGRLAQAMGDAVRHEGSRAAVVSVLGASGGLGVSTLVLTMAMLAARSGQRSVAVDLARSSGGLDLVAGAETTPGLRWGDLSGARGELGEIIGSLPGVDGVSLLAASRDSPGLPDEAAVAAVTGSLSRSSGLLVVDAGREQPAIVADHVLLVVGADVRSVAAGRMLAADTGVSPSGLVVRRGPGRTIPADVVARSLGAPCVGVVGHHPQLARMSELGLSPSAAPARRYRTEVERIVKGLGHA